MERLTGGLPEERTDEKTNRQMYIDERASGKSGQREENGEGTGETERHSRAGGAGAINVIL